MERSCMCCQESGEREAAVSLFCPKAKPGERKFRKVSFDVSFFFNFRKKSIAWFKLQLGIDKSTVRMYVSSMHWNWRKCYNSTRDCWICWWGSTFKSFSKITTSVISVRWHWWGWVCVCDKFYYFFFFLLI